METASGGEGVAGAAGDGRGLALRDGRRLEVRSDAGTDVVEIRSSAGQVEDRIPLTAAGPVLTLDAVRLELRAREAIDIETATLRLHGTRSVELSSAGTTKIASEGDLSVDSVGDVRVNGAMIYLN